MTIDFARRVEVPLRLNDHDLTTVVSSRTTLLDWLRDDIGLTGAKKGCNEGACGTCTVLVDGRPILSCLALPVECADREITTVEGMAGATLHPLQEAFAALGAAQCGYCTPGFLLTAAALLADKPAASRQEIAEATAGNLCRCTGYLKIFEAIEMAAERMRGTRA